MAVVNGHGATMAGAGADPYGTIRDVTILIREGVIDWIGPANLIPVDAVSSAREVVDLGGGWVTPGLVDCHTHIVFGGNRAREWERRLEGVSYQQIAREGGGILSSVLATRNATTDQLETEARVRLNRMIDHGVTTVEIKSGYGLDLQNEMRMLEVARGLSDLGVTVSTTLLAAHALPPKYAKNRGGYVDLVCEDMIPFAAGAGLADSVDAFCEGIAFTVNECERVLLAGIEHGLSARLHADQLSDLGGAALAARLGARSADHLEYTSEAGAEAMGEAGCAAVLLPGAFYFLGDGQKPPIDALRKHDVPLVVATDANPGSSPTVQPLVALNQACVLFGLTPAEAIAGMTRLAAGVLGLEDRGVLEVGRRADLACWNIGEPAELAYWVGGLPAQAVISGGRRIR